jgi:hypothetical protein
VDQRTMRVVDGFHRHTAAERVFGAGGKIMAVLREYPDEAAMLRDVARYNASHGKQLSTSERVRLVQMCEAHGITREEVFDLLAWPREKGDRVVKSRTAFRGITGTRSYTGEQGDEENQEKVALKRPLSFLAGHLLTQEQYDLNRHASGFSPGRLASELTAHLRARTIPDNPDTIVVLQVLHKVLTQFLEELPTEESRPEERSA